MFGLEPVDMPRKIAIARESWRLGTYGVGISFNGGETGKRLKIKEKVEGTEWNTCS